MYEDLIRAVITGCCIYVGKDVVIVCEKQLYEMGKNISTCEDQNCFFNG